MLSQTEDKKQYIGHILQNMPRKPGVYRMKSADGTVIYVGKAINLKSRVSSYFNEDPGKPARTASLVRHIADIDYTVVNSELEALILETNLIKELRPKYNVLMKDDKNYVYLKITVAERYPRIYLVRSVARDGARYFGPKTAAYKVISTLKLLKSVFPYKNCELALDYGVHAESKYKNMTPAKLEYHRAHCLGPCISSVTPEEYRKTVDKVIDFFEGKYDDILKQVKEDMTKAAMDKKFEQAAVLRDKLKNLEDITRTQIVSDPSLRDLDIANYTLQDEKAFFVLFQVRSGKLIGQENFIFKAGEGDNGSSSDPDALSAFLQQYYEKAADIPGEILLPHDLEESLLMAQWLTGLAGRKVNIKIPERGKKNSLLELAEQNANNFARLSVIKWQGAIKSDRTGALETLQKVLRLKVIPRRMECYDISHFQGAETVGSMVVFENGFPKKEDYRHFRIRSAKPGAPDDFASLEEMLYRRLKYLKPSIAASALTVKKALKKEILKLTAKKKTSRKSTPLTFCRIENNGEHAGFAGVEVLPGKKACIKSLELSGSPDLSVLFKKIAEKVKVHRLHIQCPVHKISSFEEAGCQIVQKIPDWTKVAVGHRLLVYDKIKHAVDKSFSRNPDLIVIDGGKGQLSSAVKVLKQYSLDIPVISLAKRYEEIFIPGSKAPVSVEKDSPTLNLVRHIRDESHRFAVTFHKKLQVNASTASLLDTVFGLGDDLKMRLLRQFGSVEGVRRASPDELAKVAGKKMAEKIASILNV
jgi:excinuclease ABC subunit C